MSCLKLEDHKFTMSYGASYDVISSGDHCSECRSKIVIHRTPEQRTKYLEIISWEEQERRRKRKEATLAISKIKFHREQLALLEEKLENLDHDC